MEDKIFLEELAKENLIGVLRELEPGTMLVIDLEEEDTANGYAVSTQRGVEKDGETL